jgi:uncharacterized membrane protein YidH (DUF202 family)
MYFPCSTASQERFTLPLERVDAFLTGDWTPTLRDFDGDKSAAQMLELATAMQDQLVDWVASASHMRAACRTAYSRTAFQSANNNDVRLSLDTDLFLVDEVDKSPTLSKAVNRKFVLDDLPLSAGFRFPHAVLEIKLAGDEPQWVTDLKAKWAHSLVPVYKFSKFLSSLALYHQPSLQCIPHWFKEDGSLDIDMDAARSIDPDGQDRAVNPLMIQRHQRTRAGSVFPMLAASSEGDVAGPSTKDRKASRASIPMLTRDDEKAASDSVVIGGLSHTRSASENSGPPMAVELATRNPLYAPDAQRNSAFSKGESATVATDKKKGVPVVSTSGKSEPAANDDGASGFWKAINWAAGLCGHVEPDVKRFLPVRVEPKSFFANERTYLKWIQLSIIFFTIGMVFMASQTFTGINAGIVFFVIALLVLLYSWIIFNLRAQAMTEKKSGAYDDRYGPTLLTVLLVAALATVVGYAVPVYRQYAATPTFLFAQSLIGFAPGYPAPVPSSQCQQLMTLAQLTSAGPTFQTPSSATYSNGALYIGSNQQVYKMDIASRTLTLVVQLPNTDIESVAVVGSTLFIGDELMPQIIQFDLVNRSVVRKIDLSSLGGAGYLEGLAYDSKRNLFWKSDSSHIVALNFSACPQPYYAHSTLTSANSTSFRNSTSNTTALYTSYTNNTFVSYVVPSWTPCIINEAVVRKMRASVYMPSSITWPGMNPTNTIYAGTRINKVGDLYYHASTDVLYDSSVRFFLFLQPTLNVLIAWWWWYYLLFFPGTL